MRLESAFCMLHLLDHVRVQTEAECVLVVDQRLEDKVQALFHRFQLLDVGAVLKNAAV